MIRGIPREFQQLAYQAQHTAGWSVSKTTRGHLKFEAPDGHVLFASGTPGDVREVRNVKAALRRMGLDIQ